MSPRVVGIRLRRQFWPVQGQQAPALSPFQYRANDEPALTSDIIAGSLTLLCGVSNGRDKASGPVIRIYRPQPCKCSLLEWR